MTLLSYAAAVALSTILFFALRLYPIWRQREQGCDAFNILLCAEAIRRDRRLPPRIPDLFILEEPEQWYPPVFLALCALVPSGWLRRRYWLFNQIIDLANAALLFAAVALLTDNPWLAAGAMLIYGMCAGLVQEFAALTTRPLGLLVLNLLMLIGLLAMYDRAWLPAALVAGVVLVYAHKLSAQQAWLTLPTVFVATGQWIWAALLPAMYAAAFLVWRRGFREMIRGHAAIVRFWDRNWPLLGAHAVRQSPVYGDGGKTRRDHYAAWPGGAPLAFAKETLHQSYFILPAAVGVGSWLLGSDLGAALPEGLLPMLAAWTGSVYAMAALTHFVLPLRGLGLGRQYIKFAIVPNLCLTAVLLSVDWSATMLTATAVALALTVRQYVLVGRNLRQAGGLQATGSLSEDLRRLLELLRREEGARTLVLPVHLCDLVAHATRRPVYWGTHGQCFDHRLEQFFPVLRQPLAHFIADGRLNRLLLDTRYVSASELGIGDENRIAASGSYALYRLTPAPVESQATDVRLADKVH
jgi:hypothetical protein